jgi:hypothetical protein
MFGIMDLPRVDGVIVGNFKARHASSSFSLEGFGFKFVDGLTEAPCAGRVLARLHGAYGMDVCFVPCTREDGEAALAWLRNQGGPTERIERLAGELDLYFGGQLPDASDEVREHPGYDEAPVQQGDSILIPSDGTPVSGTLFAPPAEPIVEPEPEQLFELEMAALTPSASGDVEKPKKGKR